MDPTHHEKIVDKLMQYRGKIPKTGTLCSNNAEFKSFEMRMKIDQLISDIEHYAACIELGLIQ